MRKYFARSFSLVLVFISIACAPRGDLATPAPASTLTAAPLPYPTLSPTPAAPSLTPPAKKISNRYGIHLSGGKRPDALNYATDLGAGWVRINSDLTGNEVDFKSFLDAGINLVITVNYRDAQNADTTHGTPAKWTQAGFPFKNKSVYQKQIRDLAAPLAPYLAQGRQILLQAENEVGDTQANENSIYWRGTTDQYLAQLAAFNEAVKSVNPGFGVVLSSFTSDSLDLVRNPRDPKGQFQSTRIARLLSEDQYDLADLHFYACADDIAAQAQWVKARLPAGKNWISTENSGPTSKCAKTKISWRQNLGAFEQAQAQEIAPRLQACADAGGAVCLWFSLYDLLGEVDEFNHLGLLDSRAEPPRKKAAYDAFRNFVASRR